MEVSTMTKSEVKLGVEEAIHTISPKTVDLNKSTAIQC